MKKIICVVLVGVLMLFSSFSALAVNGAEDATKELGTYEIMVGDPDGNLRLEDSVTRAEMVKMIVLLTKCPEAGECKIAFTDVPSEHWASDYIARGANAGIINGMGDGTFMPEEKVTYEQILKMIVCTLGYSVKAENMGGYPKGYVMTASSLGITPSAADLSSSASRGDVAMMLVAALDVPMMVENDEVPGEYIIQNGEDGVKLQTLRMGLQK